MKYYGIDNLEAVIDGSININTTKGLINEGAVYAYLQEENVPVDGEYRIRNNVISYDVKKNKNQIVVIDPNIIWFSYFGGANEEDILRK